MQRIDNPEQLKDLSRNGKRTDFETIGVAWARDDGGLYVKLHGTQIVCRGFNAFPIKEGQCTRTWRRPIGHFISKEGTNNETDLL